MSGEIKKTEVCTVLVTAATPEEGEKIARGLLEEKLAACVNVVHQVDSFYRWKGEIERQAEVLLIVKTTLAKYPELEAWIKGHHSYTVPEILALAVVRGSPAYLAWLGESLA